MSGLPFDPLLAIAVVIVIALTLAKTARDSRLRGPPVWSTRPPNLRERRLAGVWLWAFFGALINLLADWQIFRGYDKLVVLGLLFFGLVMLHWMPGVTRGD